MLKKAIIQATLTKLNANTKDKLDSIQFQLREDQMEKYGQEVLKIRRFDNIQIRVENPQSHIGDKGLKFFTAEFQSMATSISICVTEA